MHEVTLGRVPRSPLLPSPAAVLTVNQRVTLDITHILEMSSSGEEGGEETQRGVRSGGGDTPQHQTDYFSDSGGTKIRGRARAGEQQEVPKKEGRRQETPTGEGEEREMLLGKQQEGAEVLQNMKAKNPSLPSGGGDLVNVFLQSVLL